MKKLMKKPEEIDGVQTKDRRSKERMKSTPELMVKHKKK